MSAEQEIARRRATLALLCVLALVYLTWCGVYIHRTSFVEEGERVFCLWDDAMISMQYARNLRNGDGLVWSVGGDRVQGFTNLGVTLVMAALHTLPLEAEAMSLPFQLLNAAILVGILFLAWAAASRLFPESPWIAVGAAVAIPLCAPLSIWTLQGSDAGFVALWLLASVTAIVRVRSQARAWSFSLLVLLGAGLLIRVDMGLFFVVLLFGAAWLPGARRSWCVGGITLLVAILGAQLVFNQLYYGDPLPNTYYLKATGAPRALVLASGLERVGFWLPWLALPMAFAAFAAYRRRGSPMVLLCASLFVVGAAYNVWVGGNWEHQYGTRFLVPCLPLLLILASAGVWDLFDALPFVNAGRLRPVIATILCGTLAVLVGPATSLLEWFDVDFPTMNRNDNQIHYAKAIYLRRMTDPSTTVALHWAGVPAYFSERPSIDVLGKSDRHIARLKTSIFVPGHSKWDWDYIVDERKPDVILNYSRDLERHESFLNNYFAVIRDGKIWMFIRRETQHKLKDHNVSLFRVTPPKPQTP